MYTSCVIRDAGPLGTRLRQLSRRPPRLFTVLTIRDGANGSARLFRMELVWPIVGPARRLRPLHCHSK